MLAEITLRQQERNPGFSLLLLQIVSLDSYPYTTRLASALCFKNFIKRNWTDEEGNYKLSEDEVTAIKREIIALMISVPTGIQSQLGDAVSVIADSDFWQRWDTLVDVSGNLAPRVLGEMPNDQFCVGPCLEIRSRQPNRQRWCPPSRPFDLQEMATPLPLRRTLHRDQPRLEQVHKAVPFAFRGT